MIKRLLKKRWGFISIEIVIIAAIMLVSGFTAVGSIIEDGQTASNDAVGKIDEVLNLANNGNNGELPGGSGQVPNIPISDKLEGDGQEFHKMAPATLTFRSEADFADFQEVQIDGETVDPAYYTVSEGSTIVTLYIDYLKTLNANEHTISIVSKTAAPTATFTVVEPEKNPNSFYYNQPYTAYVAHFGGTQSFFIRESGVLDFIEYPDMYTEQLPYVVDGNYIETHNAFGTFTGTFSEDGMSLYVNELGVTFELGNDLLVADETYFYLYNKDYNGYEVVPLNKSQSQYDAIKTNVNGLPTFKLSDDMFFNNKLMKKAPTMPDSITVIGNWTFSGCEELETVTIPASVQVIGTGAFRDCNSLTDVYFEGTEAEWNSISIDNEDHFNDNLLNATIHFESTGPSN